MRKDIFSGEWVIFASNRKDKPYAYKHRHSVEENSDIKCPFCPGNENMTPPTILSFPDDGKWEIRVFNNIYPALDFSDGICEKDDFYEDMHGKGIHEVVVDTPNHTEDIREFSNEHLYRLFTVFKERLKVISSMPGIKYVQIFKNNGPMAGASIAHSHWQIMGVPVIPKEQEKAAEAFRVYKNEKDRCLMCDMYLHEKQIGKRIVDENEYFISFTPFASRQSFEMWIVPKRHVMSMLELNDEELFSLSEFLRKMLLKVSAIRENMSFNICLQEKMYKKNDGIFHWYIRILPRIGSLAGFEYSTGCFINPVFPEAAAEFYRNN